MSNSGFPTWARSRSASRRSQERVCGLIEQSVKAIESEEDNLTVLMVYCFQLCHTSDRRREGGAGCRRINPWPRDGDAVGAFGGWDVRD
jgi:hypothetical protein